MTALVFDELQRMRVAIILAEDTTFEPSRADVQRIREAFDALERVVVEAWPPAQKAAMLPEREPLTAPSRVLWSFDQDGALVGKLLPERERIAPAPDAPFKVGDRVAWLRGDSREQRGNVVETCLDDETGLFRVKVRLDKSTGWVNTTGLTRLPPESVSPPAGGSGD